MFNSKVSSQKPIEIVILAFFFDLLYAITWGKCFKILLVNPILVFIRKYAVNALTSIS